MVRNSTRMETLIVLACTAGILALATQASAITNPSPAYVLPTNVRVTVVGGSFPDVDGFLAGENDMYGTINMAGNSQRNIPQINNDNTPNWNYVTNFNYNIATYGYTEGITFRFWDDDAPLADDYLGGRTVTLNVGTDPFSHYGQTLNTSVSGGAGGNFTYRIAPDRLRVQLDPGEVWNTGVGTVPISNYTLDQFKQVVVNGGTFNVGENLSIGSGGNVTVNSGTFTQGANRTTTVSGSGLFDYNLTSNFHVNSGRTLTLTGGGDADFSGPLQVGWTTDGTVNVSGSGSTLETGISGTGSLWFAQSGGVADLNFSSDALVDFSKSASTNVGTSSVVGSSADVLVQTGADVTSDSLTIGTSTEGQGKVTVTGSGSTWVQNATSTLTVGSNSATNGWGQLFVSSSGVFTTGSGATTVNASGTIDATGGTLDANGDINVDGGSLTTSNLVWAANKTMTIENGGQWNHVATGYSTPTGANIDVIGAGSTLSHADGGGNNTLSVNGNATVDATGGGDLLLEYLFLNNGTVTVDGSGSLLDATYGNTASYVHRIGLGSGTTGTLNLSNNATGSFASLTTSRLIMGGSNSTGNLNVTTGADLTLQELDMDETGASTATVNGSGSTITQQAGSALTIGSASGTSGALNVESGGIFTASHTGTLTVKATGTLNADSGTFRANGAAVGNAGGTLNTAGAINVTGSGLISLNGRGVSDKFDPGASGAGGAINATGGTIDLSGSGRIQGIAGLAGDNNQTGNVGGTFTITGGAVVTAVDSSQIQLIGGIGGADPFPPSSAGKPGGVGGNMTVTDGSLSLGDTSTLNLRGGRGGYNSAVGNGISGTGGVGGTLTVNGGIVSVNNSATADLRGGNAGTGSVTAGNGGAGGQLLVSAGSMTVNGGLVTLAGGNKVGGGTPGAHGLVDVTGGTFEMNGGKVFTGTFQRSGGGVFNFNDGELIVSGGTFDPGATSFTINGPTAAELPTLVLTDGATTPAGLTTMVIGLGNRGRFELRSGATQTLGTTTRIGSSSTGNGQVLVDAATWTISGGGSDLAVGEGGEGALTVSNSAVVDVGDDFIAGRGGSADGTVDVTTGGSLNVANRLVVGESGIGVANIMGGSATSTNELNIAWVGPATGTLNVNGSGSLVTANTNLNVGGNNSGAGGTGKLNVSNDAEVNVTNTLRVWGTGTVNLSGGSLTADTITDTSGGAFNFTGGTLTVDNYQGVLVQNGGTLVIGGSPGTTDVTQDYVINSGTLEIELFAGGTSPVPGVDFDQVTADTASLAGLLDVIIDAGYSPTVGDEFDIITTTSGISGTFDTVQVTNLDAALGLHTLYGAHDVTLMISFAGDFDGDGKVDQNDLTLLLSNWGTTAQPAGWTSIWDGFVDQNELTDLLSNWGSGVAAEPVPEPSTLALLGISLVGIGALRRRRN